MYVGSGGQGPSSQKTTPGQLFVGSVGRGVHQNDPDPILAVVLDVELLAIGPGIPLRAAGANGLRTGSSRHHGWRAPPEAIILINAS